MIEQRQVQYSVPSGSFDDGYNSVHATTPPHDGYNSVHATAPAQTGSSVSAVVEHQHPVYPNALVDPANSQLISKVMQLTDEQV